MLKNRVILRSLGVTLVAVAVMSGIVIYAEGHTGSQTGLWNTCRAINYPLGVAVAIGVTYRTLMLAFTRPIKHDAETLHLVIWFGYIAANLLAASLTSRHYHALGVDATWISGFRTVLFTIAVVLTAWWPHSSPRDDEEEEL